MTRSERIYRALLRAYPEHTRDAYGEDMVQLFRDQLREAGSSLEQAGVWLEAITDIAITAPREHLVAGRAKTTAEGPTVELSRPITPDLVAAASPLLIAATLLIVLPGYYRPLFDHHVSVLGMPLGNSLIGATGLLAAFGVFEARRRDLHDVRTQGYALLALLGPLPLLYVLAVSPPLVLESFAVAIVVVATRHRLAIRALLALPPAALGVLLVAQMPWLPVIYAPVATGVVLAARYRPVMLALVIPLAVVLLYGPALALVLINSRT